MTSDNGPTSIWPERSALFPSIAFYVAIGLTLVGVISFSQLYVRRHKSAPESAKVIQAELWLYDKEKKQNVDLPMLIEQLSVDNRDVQERAQHRITQLASHSEENRKAVIAGLLRAVDMPAFRNRLDTAQGSYLWSRAGEILGDLKAIEAIDLLISCIDCTAVTESATDRYRHKPAVRALIGIGAPAVPKLSRALSDPNPLVRMYAALSLGLIGGDGARAALIRASTVEQDIRVKKRIKDGIDDIERSRLEDLVRGPITKPT